MAAVIFWVWAVIAGFVHGVAIFFAAYIAIHGRWTVWDLSLAIGAVLVFGTTAYGHLVFLALYLRRLERQNADLRVPKRIARVLARILDKASSAL